MVRIIPNRRGKRKWQYVQGGTLRSKKLLLMLAGRAVDAAGAIGGRAAPDALVAAGAVAVLARWRVNAPRAVTLRTTPLAVLLVVTVLMLSRRRVNTSRAIARTSAVSTFRAHVLPPMGRIIAKMACGGLSMATSSS